MKSICTSYVYHSQVWYISDIREAEDGGDITYVSHLRVVSTNIYSHQLQLAM